jgi:cell wall-associated NlpC family hydrolase
VRLRRKAIVGWGCLLVVAAIAGCGGSGGHGGGHGADGSKASAKADPPGATTSAKLAGQPGGASGGAPGKPVAKTDPPGGKADPPTSKTDPAGAKAGSASATDVKTATVKTPNGQVEVAEVRDPEEAKSFPLPASSVVHHRSAGTPSAAGEEGFRLAAGARSNAQVEKELSTEKRVETEARATRSQELTPVAGGESVGGNGTIPIPSGVPETVQRVIAGGNAIADFPYIWGGGHASFVANGYDCSGSVSYALAAGGLLSAPLVSGDLANWGEPGPGRWITIYANAGHTFMDVDGMWFDTAGRSGPYASRWLVATPPLEGYAVRHPPGL